MKPLTDNQNSDTSGQLGLELASHMGEFTRDRIQDMALENARQNLTAINQGQSLKALRKMKLGEEDKAVIVAAGPSLKRTPLINQLQTLNYRGAIIATESAMLHLLRHDIVPDLVVTVDPHHERIVRWFGDPRLNEEALARDDYFSRQDLDTSFADQLRTNDEIMSLLDKYGSQVRIAVSSSASPAVVQRAQDTGMTIYWWNPMFDDPDIDGSVTRQLYEQNGLPCVNAGGNVGTAAWMMGHAVLGKSKVAVTGMDFGYYSDTPYRNTQYFYEALQLVGEDRLDEIYMRIFNPYLQKWFYTDPAYMWYRNCFLDMVMDADCKTYNCTEGGILFGDNIEFIPFAEFVNR